MTSPDVAVDTAATERSEFCVRVHYRESRATSHDRAYRWTFAVYARDAAAAIRAARAEFRAVALESSVGRSRDIERVELIAHEASCA